MNKNRVSLRQMCIYCKTSPANCNKKKCNRYNNFKKLVEDEEKYEKLIEWLKSENLTKKVEKKLVELELI